MPERRFPGRPTCEDLVKVGCRAKPAARPHLLQRIGHEPRRAIRRVAIPADVNQDETGAALREFQAALQKFRGRTINCDIGQIAAFVRIQNHEGRIDAESGLEFARQQQRIVAHSAAARQKPRHHLNQQG